MERVAEPPPRLGMHHLGAGVLHVRRDDTGLFIAKLATGHLGEQGQDGGAAVPTDHRHPHPGRIQPTGPGDEGLGADHIQGGDAKQLASVIDTGFGQHLGGDGYSGVHRVGDDADAGVRADPGAIADELVDHGGVEVEQIGAIHAGFARHASGDHDDVRPVQGRRGIITAKTGDPRLGRDMAQIHCDSRGDRREIVQRDLEVSG